MKNAAAGKRKEIILKEINENDLPQIVAVHRRSFPDSALTKLGGEIVRRYYLWQLTGPHKKVRAVGAFLDDACAGFSFSGEFSGSTSGFIGRNRNYLIREVALHPWLIFNPLFRRRIYSGLRILKNFSRKKNDGDGPDRKREKSYGILSIAVAPEFQKLGVGQLLMRDAEHEAVKCGYERMHLTVSPENERAIRFYRKLDWEKLSRNGDWTGSMYKRLDSSGAENI
jgi:ribosomal protein S18 acetylase RimI-like enzyme